MYSDPITPKSYPDQLQVLSYDPFDLMPKALPAHPRVFINEEQVALTRTLVKKTAWMAQAQNLLFKNCAVNADVPAELPVPADPKINSKVLELGERNGLAYVLTGRKEYRERALKALRLIAHGYMRWPLRNGDCRATAGTLSESRFMMGIAQIYDYLASGRLSDADDSLFRDMLTSALAACDGAQHKVCSNIHTWGMAGRVSVASALGNLQGFHDTLYGTHRGGAWHYGLIHQLRHDILSDGLHWERTAGYHYYTTMAFVEIANVFANVDVDLWNAELPPLQQNDGTDIHRAYGPLHGKKGLKALFDAPFYLMFPNGGIPSIHDSGLFHIRGVYVWGVIYNLAYEAYRDPKYAWLLNLMEHDTPQAKRQNPGLPMPLQTWKVDRDFARYKRTSYPAGEFSLARNTSICLSGEHRNACTLFPVQGTIVLRSRSAGKKAVSASIYFGPHCAGHMAPAALHVNLHAREWLRSDATRDGGYTDPTYLTWPRTTIAHNTVTVDEASMFPYDFPTESIWECDQWRDRISDGRYDLFQVEDPMFKALRAVNEAVYPDVRLDRTVIVTDQFALDAYRVIGERTHQYDWAMHVVGLAETPAGSKPIDLGQKPGYKHFTNARRLPVKGSSATIEWRARQGVTHAHLIMPPKTTVILARDLVNTGLQLGEIDPVEPREALIMRARGSSALFLSLWTFDAKTEAIWSLRKGAADKDLILETKLNGISTRWILPFAVAPVLRVPFRRNA